MISVEAPAKVNFSLRVATLDRTGFHPLESVVQTIDWFDTLIIEWSDDDLLEIVGSVEQDPVSSGIPTGHKNLVWQGAGAFWAAQADLNRRPVRVTLGKEIPTAAGLAGGSADAAGMAVGLGALTRRTVVPESLTSVGSDVPFAVVGGSALMTGYGEQLSPIPGLHGFALVVAVPPLELSTPDVYRRWDVLDGPTGPVFAKRFAPPPLRDIELVNDLFPAAVSLAPQLLDYREQLSSQWERPVAMSGSGPSLFSFFGDVDEAASAAAETTGMRSVRSVSPVNHGARVQPERE